MRRYDQVDLMGYSFGGGAAFRLAVRHPQAVRRLVLASAPFAQDGFYPEMLPQQAAVGARMADIEMGVSPKLVAVALPSLDGDSGAPAWVGEVGGGS